MFVPVQVFFLNLILVFFGVLGDLTCMRLRKSNSTILTVHGVGLQTGENVWKPIWSIPAQIQKKSGSIWDSQLLLQNQFHTILTVRRKLLYTATKATTL